MQNLKEELENHFSKDFFPATKNEIMCYLNSDAIECSKEMYQLCFNLEDDPSFKYNSIEDILPQKEYIDYPYYKVSCGGTFHVKIISQKKAVSVQYSENSIEPSMSKCFDGHINRWSADFEKSNKESFDNKFNEVLSILNQEL